VNALGLRRLLHDLRASYGADTRWHELPQGVSDAERKRSEANDGAGAYETPVDGGVSAKCASVAPSRLRLIS
jgi:hypothetical protein